MKRIVFLIGFSLLSVVCNCQDFNKYFIDKTLRVNYLHIGNSDLDSIGLADFYAGGRWNGTRSHLVEKNRLGDVLVEVFDSLSNVLIFSRSYSCLFNEYRTTERALLETAAFEESVNIPFPKSSIRIVFTSFDRKHKAQKLYEGYFNPETTVYKQFVKEYKTVDLHIGGSSDTCIDILFLPDGYSLDDKKLMKNDLKRFASYIMNCSPYKEYKNRVNIRAVKAYSPQSGITDPNQGVFKQTILNTSYNTIDVDRYLMCLNVWKMHDIADDAPYDMLVILANSPKYGGGGIYNFYATVNNHHTNSDYVVVHELGHLIAGLADEYYTSEVSVTDYYPEGVEPVEPNVTTLVDFDSKWKNMLDAKTPVPTPATENYANVLGVYEGGGYVAEGVYRPWLHCTMKEIRYDAFCPVCSKALIDAFLYFSK